MSRVHIGISFLVLALIVFQLLALTESRKHESRLGRRKFSNSRDSSDSEEEEFDDRDLGKWERLVNMKNRLKILRKGGMYPRRNRFESRESDENSSSGSEEDSRESKRGFGRGRSRSSIFSKNRPGTYRGSDRRKYESDENRDKDKDYKDKDHSKGEDSGEDIGSEVGKLFLPKLSPSDLSGTYSSIKSGLKKRLKNIVPYCPDLHTISVLKDWGQMFKRAWPNFLEMGQKSFDYANDLRKQMAECAKHYVTKQLVKGEGGRDDYDDYDDDNWSRSDKRRPRKKPQITKGADGKNRITFTDNSSGEDESDESDGKKKKRETPKDAESLSAHFRTNFAEPITEYFQGLPGIIAAINVSIP